jgi:hypothetical protein
MKVTVGHTQPNVPNREMKEEHFHRLTRTDYMVKLRDHPPHSVRCDILTQDATRESLVLDISS